MSVPTEKQIASKQLDAQEQRIRDLKEELAMVSPASVKYRLRHRTTTHVLRRRRGLDVSSASILLSFCFLLLVDVDAFMSNFGFSILITLAFSSSKTSLSATARSGPSGRYIAVSVFSFCIILNFYSVPFPVKSAV